MAEIDITKHSLVPEHTILSENEKKELLAKMNITEKQLPKLLKSDPVVKKLEAEEGNVIKIMRNSLTAGKTVYYRIVAKR